MAVINDPNLPQFIDFIESLFFDIPSGQTKFEIEKFVVNDQITAERAFRVIGLRIREKILEYMTAKFTRGRELVDIDELTAVINDRNTPPFTLRRAQISVDEKNFNVLRLNKTMNDALLEINFLNEHLERLPEFSEDDLDLAEPVYHNERLSRELLRGLDVAKEIATVKQRNPALEKRRNGNGVTAPSTNGNPR